MEKLIFVYNAYSGTQNAVLDALHKLIKPNTYACSICKVTHGVFSENSRWKKYRQTSDVQMEFLYIDEFQKRYASKFGYKYTFPIVLWEDEVEMGIFIPTEELERTQNEEDLIKLIEERL
ncbi:GTPase [Salegentibacter sp. LM13S]|uniref:GTPase n=1 Tax=Salegentibacter lacus TaxID=2873599 RepID=UPI001CCA1BC5|nr:GTPase [Salegentibacter lacus]MBZ9629309.1 GTPase [Salegentibacter lacus]